MSFIKPRTRGKQFMQHRTRLDRENHETLYAYAAFINEEPEYVLNELIDTVLAKDKDFLKWRPSIRNRVCHSPRRVRRIRRASGTVDRARTARAKRPAVPRCHAQ